MKKSSKILSLFLAVIVAMSAIIPVVSLAQTVKKSTSSTTAKIDCYVSRNSKWVLIGNLTTNKKAVFSKTRYYVTASELEKVYGEYGFSADSLSEDSRIFPHTDTDDPTRIWADETPIYDDELKDYLIPVSTRVQSYLYYMPYNVEGNKHYFSSYCQLADGNVCGVNTFFTLAFNDYQSLIPDGSTPEFPKSRMVFNGTKLDIKLPLVDGVSYICENLNNDSTLSYTQTVDNDNKTVTISIPQLSYPTNIYTKADNDDTKSATVYCYVSVNDQWKLVKSQIVSGQVNFGKNRYYITTKQLEDIYKDYGFSEANYNGEAFFPHTDIYDPATIWADTSPKFDSSSNTYLVPVSNRKENYLYYLPHNSSGYDSYFTSSTEISNKSLLSDNSFYTVQVKDTGHFIDSSVTLPDDLTLLSGASTDIVLPLVDDINYTIINPLTNTPINFDQTIDNDAKTVTVSVKNISCPVLINTSNGTPTITYNASIEGQMVQIGEFPVSRQILDIDGTINNQSSITETLDSSAVSKYRLLNIDTEKLSVSITNGNNRHFYYSFLGWRVGTTDAILQPGDELTLNELKVYADSVTNNVMLTAVWNTVDTNGRVDSINFYVNLNCEIADNMSTGFRSDIQNADEFTSSIYTTRIFGTENVPLASSSANPGVQVIAPPTSSDTAYDVDAKLRNSVSTPLDPGVTIENYPSNEDVFARLRSQNRTLTIDGQVINKEDITSDNFTIRWYVLKYVKADGWHIDGVLVAKAAKIVVKKTFAGDYEAIDKVKKNFEITVSHSLIERASDDLTANDYTLTLNSKANETDSSKTGYDYYDAETDTYTWVITGRQYSLYTIKENNYILDQNKWNNSIQYKITNSVSNNTNGWETYNNDGVDIFADAYPNDVPISAIQMVEFRNMYVQSGILAVNKIDSNTQNGLKNVSFKLSKVDGTKLNLYKRQGSSEYSTDSAANREGYYEVISDNIVTTDANGYFTVKLAIHGTGTKEEQYYLEEVVPDGYEGPSKIKITVTDLGKIQFAQEVIESTTVDSDWLDGIGTNTLTIKNKSKLLTSVKAQKDWGNTDKSKTEDVTVQLWRNGAKLSNAIYTQKLSADNNWQYEWENLPLYTDGEPSVYTIKEVAIGSTSYDPDADTDGYADYMVTYDTPLYKDGDNGTYTENQTWLDDSGTRHYANHALLVLHNRLVEGEIAFAKVDDLNRPLQGAEFTLYSDENCTNPIETVTSDTSGYVKFSTKSSGTYYMKETKVPADYIENSTIYKIVVKAGKVTITENGSTTPITSITNYYSLRNIEFSFIKVGENTQPLSGAEFGLYKLICTDETHDHSDEQIKINSDGTPTDAFSSCWELVSIQTSARKTGLVKFDGLRGSDTYRLIETKSPNGYASPKGQWQIVYNRDVTPHEYNITAIGTVSQVPAFEKVQNELAPYRLMNYKLNDIPSSGGIGITPFAAVGGILFGFGIIILVVLVIKKRNTKE